MKLLLIREKWSHMSDVSGFDPLFKAINENPNCQCTSILINEIKPEEVNKTSRQPSFALRLFRWVWRKLNKPKPNAMVSKQVIWPAIHLTPGVQPVHELAFKQIVKLDESEKFDFILFSVAEDQLGYGLYYAPISFKKRCVLFFHQPPSWLKLHWGDFKILNEFGLIVSLSLAHKQFLQAKIKTPILHIRHGVDLNFFYPSINRVNNNIPNVLFVGNWYRDFEMLEKVTAGLLKQGVSFNLKCVVPRKDRQQPWITKLAIHSNVEFFADLSPEALKELYQSSDLFFLPLLDSTANNALNEAMASGLYIVTTLVGGVVDYIPDEFCALAKRDDVEDHTIKLKKAIEEYQIYKMHAAKIRQHAEMILDWKVISNEVISALKDAHFTPQP